MSQLSFLSIGIGKKTLRCERFLREMDEVIPWTELCGLIRPYYSDGKKGRPPMGLELMLRIYFLQQWFNLSDPQAEESIYDRNSFQRFLGLDLLSGKVPDETTILNFRHLLERHNLGQELFMCINEMLENKGLLLKEGTIVDATIIHAPKSTKNADKKRDPEMSSTRKHNQFYFGMKAHIGTQSRGKPLVHSVTVSTAKDHDKKHMDKVLHGQEQVICGDKGYIDREDKRRARKRGVSYLVMDKIARGRCGVKSKSLSIRKTKKNKKIASLRAKVEHVFQIIKCQWGYKKTRYRGLKKNEHQIVTLVSLANLYMVRKFLLT